MKEKLTFLAICFPDNLFGQEDSFRRTTSSAVSSRVESHRHQVGGAGLDKDVEAFDFPYVEALAAAAAVAAVATVLVVAGVTATR